LRPGQAEDFRDPSDGDTGRYYSDDSSTWADAANKGKLPLYLKDPNNLYWYEYLKDQKIVYIQHNGIANKDDERLPTFTSA
jgi:hypothetical protein